MRHVSFAVQESSLPLSSGSLDPSLSFTRVSPRVFDQATNHESNDTRSNGNENYCFAYPLEINSSQFEKPSVAPRCFLTRVPCTRVQGIELKRRRCSSYCSFVNVKMFTVAINAKPQNYDRPMAVCHHIKTDPIKKFSTSSSSFQ